MSAVSRREAGPSRVARFVPIVAWLPKYQRSWLPNDAVAGFTIWGLLIPEMIAYASLAGLSPQAGLYTLLASLALYAIFGTSRHLVVAATSASAVLIFSAVTTAALSPESVHGYATLAAGMILITGLFLVLAGICKLGFITSFLSRPVMEGFVFGLAIFVTISQLPKLFGVTKGSGDSVRQLAHLVTHLGDTSLTTLAIGLLALALLFGVERYAPRIPGGLVVLVVGIGLSAGLNLSRHGVDTVGKIPTGLPSVAWPHLTLSELWVLVPSSIGMMLVSPLVAAVLSLVTVVALTPLFTDLPEAVLGALIIGIVFSLALLIYRASRPQVSVLGADPDNPATFEDVERHPEATPVPGVLVVRPDAPLFYANAQGIRDTVEADVFGANEAVNAVIFDLDANDEIDITSAEQLEKLAEGLHAKGVAFAFDHLHKPAEDMARATGLLEKVGTDHVFPTVAIAVQWAKSLK